MKLLIIFCFVISSAFAELNKLQCIEHYFAKTVQSLERSEQIACKSKFKNLKNKFSDLFLDSDLEDDKTCALFMQENYKLADLYLKGVLSHLINQTEEVKFKEIVKDSIGFIQHEQFLACETDDRLQKSFESRYRMFGGKPLTKNQECLKKFFMETGIIDPVEFNIEFNLSTVEVSDCLEVLNGLTYNEISYYEIESLFGLSLDNANACMKENSKDVTLRLKSFQIISTFELTEEKLEEVKTRFAKVYDEFMKMVFECMITVL